MKEKTNGINIINAENCIRMGFYVPGHGIITKTSKGNNVAGIRTEIMKSLSAIEKRNKQ